MITEIQGEDALDIAVREAQPAPAPQDVPAGVFILRDYLDLVEEHTAAEALGLRVSTIAAYRRAGTGPDYVQIGRNVFYRRADLKQWLESYVVVQKNQKRARA